MKDNFSDQSDYYALFRPGYPDELFDLIYSFVGKFELALDCATGNGQIAEILSERFENVIATDISQNQLEHAFRKNNIEYRLASAEDSGLPAKSFDLITVGQAAHWFRLDLFYKEVHRLLKEDGVLAVIGYGLIRISDEIDSLVNELYSDHLREHWDIERKFIDEEYNTLPFEMKYVDRIDIISKMEWTFDHFIGYLQTWSAVKHYSKKYGRNIVQEFKEKLRLAWGSNDVRNVSFPVFVLVGRNNLSGSN